MDIHKISKIIAREFNHRVRKKSFIIMTILGPFLFAAMIILPIYFTQIEDKEVKIIAVVDSSKIFTDKIPDTKNIKFKYLENINISNFLNDYREQGYWGVLYISHIISYSPNSVILYSHNQAGLTVQYHIENSLKKEIEHLILQSHNLEGLDKTLETLKSNVNLRTIKLEEGGKQKESNSQLAMILGYVSGFLIYLFVFLFGTQVMRGVIEEKSNRVVEVIISSVKPFELMMGKIIGIGGVALLQFVLWIILTIGFVKYGQQTFFPELNKITTQTLVSHDVMDQAKTTNITNIVAQNETKEDPDNLKIKMTYNALSDINYAVILSCFIFFFLGGYLLYASLFAAIGSAVDSEADTQQFMLPITIPLILAIYVMINTMNNPDNSLSFWFSIIPLTSPIVMMVRIPFGVPYWEVFLSMVLLIANFILFTWLAGKIYRTGILMYGKKISYKDLWKWITFKG